MGLNSCSRCLLLCPPSSHRARQWRTVLTIRTNQTEVRMMPVPAGKSHLQVSLSPAARRTQRRSRPASHVFALESRRVSNSSEQGPRTVLRSGSTLMRGSGRRTPKTPRNLGYQERPSHLANGRVSLAANVSTIRRRQARRDDGEHSGRQRERDACLIVAKPGSWQVLVMTPAEAQGPRHSSPCMRLAITKSRQDPGSEQEAATVASTSADGCKCPHIASRFTRS